MVGPSRAMLLAAVLGFAASRCSSSSPCVHPPCPLPRALLINVTSLGGEAITGATAAISGPLTSPAIPCNAGSLGNMCIVNGYGGTYDIRVSAPGYQTVAQTIIVTGNNPECGCQTADTRMVTIALPAQR